MSATDRWIRGGYTRICSDCGHTWAVSTHRWGEIEDRPCPECGYVPPEEGGETIFDRGTCPGCGKSISKKHPPVSGFPGQGYCSGRCAGL